MPGAVPLCRPRYSLSIALFSLAYCVIFALLSPPVRAQTTELAGARYFDIPSGPLDQALAHFASELGIVLSADATLTQGKTAPALQGLYTVEDGFTTLLVNSGLHVVHDASGIYTLQALKIKESTLASVDVRATSLDDQLKDAAWGSAGSSIYMTRDEIERSRGTSVGDIFKGTTGVLVGENRNSGGLDINIRGMQGQGRVPILVDGARQEHTVYRGYSGVASRSYVDPDLIGGIQIDKGPTLSAQGTGATGGLVTMRTINADDILRPGQTLGIRLRGQAIGNNTGSAIPAGTPTGLYAGGRNGGEPVYRTDCATATLCSGQHALPEEWGYPEGLDRPNTLEPQSYAGSIAIAKRWEKLDLVAAYAQRRQGNYYAGEHGPSAWMDTSDRERLPFYTEVTPSIQGATIFQAGERIPGTNYESSTTLLKAKTFLPHEQELELSFMRYDSEYSEIMPSQITRFQNFVPVTQPENSKVRVDTYTSRYHWKPAEYDLLDFKATLWHTDTDSLNNSPSDVIAGWYDTSWENYKRWGLNLENTSSFKHGRWGESQLRYGLAGQWENLDSIESDSYDDTSTTGRSGSRDEYSAFGSWQYKPIQTLTFEAGLRYTRFESQDDRDIVPRDTSELCTDTNGDGACDPIANRNKKSGSAPVASVIWEPGMRGLQFFGRYAEAYRMPSLFESTQGFSIMAQPDIILQPEHTRSKEVGINYLHDGLFKPDDKLRLKFAYFQNKTTDYLTRTTANLWETDVTEDNNSSQLVMRNIDSAMFNGLEFSGSYDIGWAFTDFGVTKYNEIEICHRGSYRIHRCNDYGIAGSYINNMVPPNWHANITVGTRLLQRKLMLGVRAILMGKRNTEPEYNNDTDRSFLQVVPWHAYEVFDFFASYQHSDRMSFDFNLDNFTDRYYLDSLGLGLIPAPGRTARLSMTLRY